jgi:hypothetical protein
MTIADIIRELDAEMARLQKVKAILSSGSKIKRATKTIRKRVLSKEARARIAAAQRKRWAAQKKAAK